MISGVIVKSLEKPQLESRLKTKHLFTFMLTCMDRLESSVADAQPMCMSLCACLCACV